METQATNRKISIGYNPDVLDCLANLSNDEVFTPPRVANQMLDMLPQELFRNPDTTFLDPVSKSGVFLREIVKRLMVGLEDQIPDRYERINHIFTHQVFGIAITNLTALISRRSVYCSKTANHSKYSYCSAFGENKEGFIHFREIEHSFVDGKCKYCGAAEAVFGRRARGAELESHAYEFIHTDKPEKLFPNVKFDVIIGNPPYQLNDGGNAASAIPLYQLFVQQAKKLNPHYLTMIIPARWYAGGRGLEDFRKDMLNDDRILFLSDFPNSADCFPNVNIAGGICYFLWNRDKHGSCDVLNIKGSEQDLLRRKLNQFEVFVRSNKAVAIIEKIQNLNGFIKLSSIAYSANAFGFRTFVRGSKQPTQNSVELITSEGISYVDRDEVKKCKEAIDYYNIIMTRAMSGGNKPSSDGKYVIIPSTMRIMNPGQICAETYQCVGKFENLVEAENAQRYFKTLFVRFLMFQAMSGIMINRDSFQFVPLQDFSRPWTDADLYAKYDLTQDEIDFIESMIRPMD